MDSKNLNLGMLVENRGPPLQLLQVKITREFSVGLLTFLGVNNHLGMVNIIKDTKRAFYLLSNNLNL